MPVFGPSANNESMQERRSARPYAVALGVLWGLPLLGVIFLHLTLPKENASGQCDGIGFGCTLPPADGVLFLAIYFGPVLLVVGVLVCGAIAVVQGHRMRSQDQVG
jgi:hypothetical protein